MDYPNGNVIEFNKVTERVHVVREETQKKVFIKLDGVSLKR